MQHAHLENRITHRVRGSRWSLTAWGMALGLAGVTAACAGGRHEPSTAAHADVARTDVAVEPASTESERRHTTPAEAPELAAAPAPAPAPAEASLAGPPTDLTPPAPGDEHLTGTVIEHLPAGHYHYMRVAPEHGDPRWVVTMGGEYREGARVEVSSFGARHDFYSRRLDRSFAELVFGMVDVVG